MEVSERLRPDVEFGEARVDLLGHILQLRPEMVDALHIRVFLGTEKIADTTSTDVVLTCQPGGPGLLIQYAVNIPSDVDVFSLIDQAGSIEVQLDFTGPDGPDTAETSHSGLFTLDF